MPSILRLVNLKWLAITAAVGVGLWWFRSRTASGGSWTQPQYLPGSPGTPPASVPGPALPPMAPPVVPHNVVDIANLLGAGLSQWPASTAWLNRVVAPDVLAQIQSPEKLQALLVRVQILVQAFQSQGVALDRPGEYTTFYGGVQFGIDGAGNYTVLGVNPPL